MADQPSIPELQFNHPDGRPRSRIEMDQWLRGEVPKVHWLRIIATRTFGLPKTISWDMREIVLKHWLLDEMVRRQLILGDQLGVNAQQPNDEGELRQFAQRLTALIQSGQAVQPQQAEGVDMTFQPPPPPIGGAPNGQAQQAAYPPGPPQPPPQPPGPPQGFQPPQPPGGYAPPPPQPPQQMPQQPMGPPGGYAQPPAPPPVGAPQMGPPMGPPGPPAPGAQPVPSRRGRGAAKNDASQGAPQAAPVPPMSGPPGAPQGFAPAPLPPQTYAGNTAAPVPPMQSVHNFQIPTGQQAAAPQVDLSGIMNRLDQVLQHNAVLAKQVEHLSMLTTVLGRAIYQKQGSADPVGFLKELGIIPQ